MSDQPFAGANILIVEDEPLIAVDVEQICIDEGAASVHIARALTEIDGINLRQFHAAILDKSVGLDMSYDLARRLRELAIPFIFTSGLVDEEGRAQFPDVPLVPKPYSTGSLVQALTQVLKGRVQELDAST